MTILSKRTSPILGDPGKVASTTLTLYRTEAPYDGPWRAPVYSLFSNANKTAIFLSCEEAPIPVWNPDTERYEVRICAESISTGQAYNLPEGAINHIVSEDLLGFTGVINEDPCMGGQDPPPKKENDHAQPHNQEG